MVMVVNRANGPRSFQTKGPGDSIAPRVLEPGASADMELVNPDADKVLQGWIQAGEVAIGEEAQKLLARSMPPPDKLQEERTQLLARLSVIDTQLATITDAGLAADMTPPAQLSTDGGPVQVPTVDGLRGGAPTPTQEGGNAEQQRIAETASAAPAVAAASTPSDAAKGADAKAATTSTKPAKPA